MPRMRILSAQEQKNYDYPPVFDYTERKQMFRLSKSLLDTTQRMRTSTSQIGFLLMCVYFKATKRFFLPNDFQSRDIEVAAHILNLNITDFDSNAYTETTRLRHQKKIVEFYGFVLFDTTAEEYIAQEIQAMACLHLKPKLIFERCLDLLVQNRITLPGSYVLTDMIRSGLKQRRQELNVIINDQLLPDTQKLLDGLFEIEDHENRYRLTLIKKLSQSTRPTKIKESVADFQTLTELYQQFDKILPALSLGIEGIRYYAGSVVKSQIFQLTRRTNSDRYVHAIAFVTHQLYRLQDNLIDMLLSVVKSCQNTASREHKEQVYIERKSSTKRTLGILEKLDTNVIDLIRQVRQVIDDENVLDGDKVQQIRLLVNKSPEDTIKSIRDELTQHHTDGLYYDSLEARSLRLQNRLNPIVKAVTFESCGNESALLAAIKHFKSVEGKVTHTAPLEFLDPDERSAVYKQDGSFRPSLYKVFLFFYIASAIKSGNLNFSRSYKYRPLNDYLISDTRWQQEKTALMKRAGLSEFADVDAVLNELDEKLYEQYQETNTNAPTNPHLKVISDSKFTIATPAKEESRNEKFGSFYPEQHIVPLPEILFTVNQHCGFLNQFEHWQQSHARSLPSPSILFAGIMGLGCGIGVRKMAQISANITENELENTVNWRFSLDNIQAANDRVLSAMDKMELPNLNQKSSEKNHTASDGQKFEVRGESLIASRSFKYFGKEQGVSAYTFADMRDFLWHSLIISASDRESMYVVDGLMRNDIVKSHIHSTDTHGYSEAIFATTHLLGFSYAPRIKNLKKQILYLFRSRQKADREDWLITPDKYVNTSLIREHWDDLLRLIATIKLKETTASDIFRRLNSYSRQHHLYQSLKAFGQIIKSLFILRYIDDLELRQAIEKQLNKVELVNKFTRAVAVGSPHEFIQTEKTEQEIAEACNRLIKNCIICWNYLYLTRKLEQANSDESRENITNFIRSHSPVAWGHINLLGEYDFSDEKLKDTVGILS